MFCVLSGPVLRDCDWRPLALAHFSGMVSELCRLLVLSWFPLSSILCCSRGRITFRRMAALRKSALAPPAAGVGRQYPFATPDPLTGWSRPKRSDGPPVTSRSMGGMRTLVSLQAISCRHSYTVREPTEVACIGGNRLKIARRTVTSAAHLIACLSMAASVVGRGWRH